MRLILPFRATARFSTAFGRAYASASEVEPRVNATTKANASLGRFWKTVDVAKTPSGFTVTLDQRPIKTPSSNLLEIPSNKMLLAALVAQEWDSQEKTLKTHALPLTSLVARAIDFLSQESSRQDVCKALLRYLDTDTICFHSTEPPALLALQEEYWIPILKWAKAEYSIELKVFDNILQNTQPNATHDALERVLLDMDPWELAAMERATYASKSFLIALALIKGAIPVENAVQASEVEVRSQIQRWGEVEDGHDVEHQDLARQLGSAVCVSSTY